jgi:hypothetical protein
MNTGIYGRVDPGDSFGVTENFTASDTLTTAAPITYQPKDTQYGNHTLVPVRNGNAV